jgi:glycosyltransferase involved in cell wall biosynthesis
MNICLISQEYPPDTARGGIGTQTWNKARKLVMLGHEVHVLTASSRMDSKFYSYEEDGVIVHRMPSPDCDQLIYAEHTYWLGYSWEVYRYLQRLRKSVEFDVIDVAEYGAEGFVYQMDRTVWNWIPTVVQLHGPIAMFSERIGWPEADSDFYRVATFMERLSIERADALMACSANIADFTSRFYDVPLDEIDVVHCGVDTAAFQSTDVDKSQHSVPTVLFVGNIAANKGVYTVVNAVLALRERFPDIRLQILGRGDGDELRNIETMADEAGAAQNIDVVGFVGRDKLPQYYRQATVFCSPALHEVGVANVYIEAMASGCPVIAADTGGAPEAVHDGEHGFLVTPNDVDALSDAIARIVSDPHLQKTMGQAARQRAVEYFAMDRYIERVLHTYQRAIDVSARKLHTASSDAALEDAI